MDGTVGGTCDGACTYEFDLPDSHSGRYTLKELVTMDMGVQLSLTDDTLTPWEGTASNAFAFSSSDISLTDNYYCFAFGLNYPNPATRSTTMRNHHWTARARIGVKMDNAFPCAAAYSAEGIGLSNHKGYQSGDYVNSGRLQHDSQKAFKAATVWVYGSTTKSESESTIVQLGIDDYTSFGLELSTSERYSLSMPVDDTHMSFVFYMQIHRDENWWRQIFRRGYSTW